MKIFAKRTLAIAMSSFMLISMAGCKQQPTEEELAQQKAEATAAKEIKQNDYRGSVKRTLAIKDEVISLLDTMKSNNIVLREDSPNSFWNMEGYQDFVSTFLDYEIFNDTQWFNEESADWETTVNQISSQSNSFTKTSDGKNTLQTGVSVIRNEKDDYSVTGVPWVMNIPLSDEYFTYSGKANYRVLYDCDKDWCKAYSTMTVVKELPATTVEMFEYQRINDDVYAIQTSRERLMVIFDPVEEDTDIRNRTIKEFYYSKLVSEGQRTTFDPYEPLPEVDVVTKKAIRDNEKFNLLMAENPAFNADGECCSRYGEQDSMFYEYEITKNWVFEDKSLQQAICYKDGTLLVTTYNKLSDSYERYVYATSASDESIKKELEELVEIKNLVGIVEVKIYTKSIEDKQNDEQSEEASEPTSASDIQSEEQSDKTAVDTTVAQTEANEPAQSETTSVLQTEEPIAYFDTTVAE